MIALLLSWVRKLELFEVTKRPRCSTLRREWFSIELILLTPTVLSVLTNVVMKDLWLLMCWGQNITAMSRIGLLQNRLNVQEKCILNNPFRLWNCYSGGPLGLPLYWTKFCLKCIVHTLLRPSPFYSQFLPTAREGNAFTPVRLFTGGWGWADPLSPRQTPFP